MGPPALLGPQGRCSTIQSSSVPVPDQNSSWLTWGWEPIPLKFCTLRPGAVAHTCNPSTLGGRGGQVLKLEVRSLRSTWPTWGNSISTKNTKISGAWWCIPVVPATRGAETGVSLEPGRWRLQWAEMAPLHSCLGNRARFHLKRKNKRRKYFKHCNALPINQSFIEQLLCSIVCRTNTQKTQET